MKALRCDFCGGQLVMDQSREFATCEFCGTKYMKETVQEKIQEIRGEVKISGAVETYKGDAEKERLLKNAETYIHIKEFQKAAETYEQLTEQFPDDYRGWWGVFTTQVERYFHTGSFKEKNPRALEFTQKLCKDISPIRQYFDNLAHRYGKNIRLTSTSPASYFTFINQPINIAKIDELTFWIIYKSVIYNSFFSDRFKEFTKGISDQYIFGIKNGQIIIPVNFSAPPLCSEKIGLSLSGLGISLIIKRLAQTLNVSYVSLSANPAINHPLVSTKFYNKVKHIEFTEIVFIFGKWLLVKEIDGNTTPLLMPVELTQSTLYQWSWHCKHCGGNFTGLFKQVCSVCGKPKDY